MEGVEEGEGEGKGKKGEGEGEGEREGEEEVLDLDELLRRERLKEEKRKATVPEAQVSSTTRIQRLHVFQ